MSYAIEIQNVTKKYGTKLALDNVSLQIPQGCVFALLGENGAGKTTLVRILLGLLAADEGTTSILGSRQAFASDELAMRVGYVADRPMFHEWMTVSETGWFASGFLGESFLDRFQELITHFQLVPHRKVRELSKGMRAKLALSMALAKDPDVLVLDEPTSGLDALIRREVLESLVDLAAAGKTIFLCSHQIQEIERVADYVAILEGSRLKAVERLERLKTIYHEVRVTMSEVSLQVPEIGGEVLRERRVGRQWQLFVRAERKEDLRISELEAHPQVKDVEVSTPSLEEIFVGLLGHRVARESGDRADITFTTSIDDAI